MSKQEKKELVPERRFPKFRDDGEWQLKTFNELFTIGNGRDYKHLTSGEIPVYGSGGYMLSVNDYLYDGESACIGRKGTIDNPIFLAGKFWTVDTLFYTHSFKECLPKFIYAIFQQINWVSHNEAGGVPSLSKTNIGKIKVAVPKPAEQQKITDCISSIDELIIVQTQKIESLKTYKKGLMQQLLPAAGSTMPKLRFPEFRNKGEWVTSTIGDICRNVASGGTPSRTIQEYWNGDIPWVSTTLIDFNTIQNVNEYISKSGLSNSPAKIFPKNTILMAMYGQGKTRGKVAVLGINAATNQACAALLLNKGMNTEFVFQNLAVRYDEIRRISNPGGQENLSATLIKSIPFSYPDIESGEQQKIADCLASIDKIIIEQAQKIEFLRAHKKGLMQQLFSAIDEADV
ncbi:restriction endonuclease subunit S [Pseudomonas sp. ArH3a]|uniref:restriction endonuclease subunit S n=1 Tax=Pseudomonas sp. ArH3a TaxID=2862945 RepID=UPI001F56E0A4|nr:restriction endonuclease subunit S [Pseudomonas sp. ArH3a]UNM20287.1 restriction endonuclease subunit S [Pseudomonas sp. ArH3a]